MEQQDDLNKLREKQMELIKLKHLLAEQIEISTMDYDVTIDELKKIAIKILKLRGIK